ncbi:unnamed protein product [Polarella glacialis]|uniref:Uncharacterized protein n=1 Tax=Polarella glacialis TaxID=89957 RepID=A0A813LFL9_POLGL|nr:unnamed protein product [Polarella glacialis]
MLADAGRLRPPPEFDSVRTLSQESICHRRASAPSQSNGLACPVLSLSSQVCLPQAFGPCRQSGRRSQRKPDYRLRLIYHLSQAFKSSCSMNFPSPKLLAL